MMKDKFGKRINIGDFILIRLVTEYGALSKVIEVIKIENYCIDDQLYVVTSPQLSSDFLAYEPFIERMPKRKLTRDKILMLRKLEGVRIL
jgi:hypothetical protein